MNFIILTTPAGERPPVGMLPMFAWPNALDRDRPGPVSLQLGERPLAATCGIQAGIRIARRFVLIFVALRGFGVTGRSPSLFFFILFVSSGDRRDERASDGEGDSELREGRRLLRLELLRTEDRRGPHRWLRFHPRLL